MTKLEQYKSNSTWLSQTPQEKWMSDAWKNCDSAVVLTKGSGLDDLPVSLRLQVPSARCLESIIGYLALAIAGRRAGIIGDGDFDLMVEQAAASVWSIREPVGGLAR